MSLESFLKMGDSESLLKLNLAVTKIFWVACSLWVSGLLFMEQPEQVPDMMGYIYQILILEVSSVSIKTIVGSPFLAARCLPAQPQVVYYWIYSL